MTVAPGTRVTIIPHFAGAGMGRFVPDVYGEPYSSQEFADAIAFAEAWQLTGHMRDTEYTHLALSVSV